MSIPDWAKKINTFVLIATVVVLVATLAWGGVKIKAISAQKEPILIDVSGIAVVGAETLAPAEKGIAVMPTAQHDVQFVASKSGTKYHLLTCSGAKTIVEKNRIYFKTEAEARTAGYSPAANCKGLSPEATKPK